METVADSLPSPRCSEIQLLAHILRISSRRDRTEINAELLEALADLFQPTAVRVMRCYANDEQGQVFHVAGYSATDRYCRNAYLPEERYCEPIDDDPLLGECWRTLSMQNAPGPQNGIRLVLPIVQDKKLHYLLECLLADDCTIEQRILLLGLTEFFAKHISLLDYGETDTLTELANRKTFDKHLYEVLGSAADDSIEVDETPHQTTDTADTVDTVDTPKRRLSQATSAQHWLAVCDIDKFKSINDNHGHLIGDEVLVMMAQLLRRSFRLADQLFRFGGEEFIVVLQPTSRADALRIFERFRRQVETHVFSRVGRVTISIGFTRLVVGDSPSRLIDRADEALYYAKEHGRNRVALYEALVETGRMAEKTIENGEIELF